MRVPVAVADAAHNPDDLLRRELGVRQLAAAIFNDTVGSGIFVLPALVAARLGSTAILAYLVCAVVITPVAICFAEAGSRISASGGPYAYVEAAMGPLPVIAGVLNVAGDIASAAVIATIFAGSVAAVTGAASAAVKVVLILFVFATVAAINIRGVGKGARLVETLLAAKIAPLLLFVVAGAAFVRPANVAWTSTPSPASVLGTAGIAFGRDGLAPRALARVHLSFRTPHVAIVTYAAIAAALSISGTFERLAILSNVSALILYLMSAIAAWILRRRDVRTNGNPFVAPGGPLVPLLTCVAIGWMLAETATRLEWGAVAIVVVIALGIYALRARRVSLALGSP